MSAVADLLKEKRKQVRGLKADLKDARKTKKHGEIEELKKMIEYEQGFIRRFSVSQMEPVRVGEIVVNKKLFDRFIKKLKGFQYTVKLIENRLQVDYGDDQKKGKLELNDITDCFLEGAEFPAGDIKVDG